MGKRCCPKSHTWLTSRNFPIINDDVTTFIKDAILSYKIEHKYFFIIAFLIFLPMVTFI